MAQRSWCPSGAGAVAVDISQRVIQSGYAGPPAGFKPQMMAVEWELELAGCAAYCERAQLPPAERDPGYTDCPSSHAEINCLVKADSTRLIGGTMYVSSVPCLACAKATANSGVARVAWHASAADEYRDPAAVKKLLDDCHVSWEEVPAIHG